MLVGLLSGPVADKILDKMNLPKSQRNLLIKESQQILKEVFQNLFGQIAKEGLNPQVEKQRKSSDSNNCHAPTGPLSEQNIDWYW